LAQKEKKRTWKWEYTKLMRGYEIFDHHAPNLVEDESSAVYLLSLRNGAVALDSEKFIGGFGVRFKLTGNMN